MSGGSHLLVTEQRSKKAGLLSGWLGLAKRAALVGFGQVSRSPIFFSYGFFSFSPIFCVEFLI
jgi:hypothetical protein